MFDAKPEDRDKIALYVQEIITDHKMGKDGVLVAADKIFFGKRGASNYQQIYEVDRLKKENPQLWEYVRPLYERWKADRTITREGLSLEAWPAITKGQIKACNDLGLFTVEDIGTATDSIRQKLGIGANDLISKARAFVANLDGAKQAAEIAQMKATIESQARLLEEQRETMTALAAAAGKSVRKPRIDKEAA
jgi:hypothetical protein